MFFISLMLLALAYAPGQAAALDFRVESASIHYKASSPEHGDLALSARVPGAAAEGGTPRLAVGAQPVSEKDLVLDAKTGLLTASIAGFARIGADLVPVRLASGTFSGCTMLHFRKRTPLLWTFDAVSDPQYRCAFTEAPESDTPSVAAGSHAQMRVYLRLVSLPGLDRSAIRIVRLDADGHRQGEPLCMLAAEPGETGRYSCLLELHESEPGARVRLAADASFGETRVLSPPLSIEVTAPLPEGAPGDESPEERPLRRKVEKIVDDADAREPKDAVTARQAAVVEVKKLDEISDAGLDPKPEYFVWYKGKQEGAKTRRVKKRHPSLGLGDKPPSFDWLSVDALRKAIVLTVTALALSTLLLLAAAYSDANYRPPFLRNVSIIAASLPSLVVAAFFASIAVKFTGAASGAPVRNALWAMLTAIGSLGSRPVLEEKVVTRRQLIVAAVVSFAVLGIVVAYGLGDYLKDQ